MADWEVVTLGAVCSRLTVGHVGSMASRYVKSGIPFLRSLNVKPGRIDSTDVKFIDSDFHAELKKSQLNAGDLVIVRTGAPGTASLVPSDAGPMNCADLVIATPVSGVDGRFLCYAVNATAQSFIRAHTVGAVQQHFNVKSAQQLPIAIPSFPEQRAISGLLGALDDKIAVNERIAGTADELRRLLFARAIRQESSSFADEPLSASAEFVNGKAFTKVASGTGRMVVRIAEINNGPGASTVYNDIVVPDQHLANPGDVLFAWSGSLMVTRWFRPEAIINQHIFKVIPENGFPVWLAHQLVDYKIEEFRAIAADKATTMGHIQRRHLDQPVPTPTAEMAANLDRTLGPLWDRALAAEQESLVLANLRDTLLPQLMSGEICVRDAEKTVEEAV